MKITHEVITPHGEGKAVSNGEEVQETTTTGKQGGGICGPVVILGLSTAPLLLKRRR